MHGPGRRRLAPLIAAFFFGGVALWVPSRSCSSPRSASRPATIGLMAAAYAAARPAARGRRPACSPTGGAAAACSSSATSGRFASVLVGGLSTTSRCTSSPPCSSASTSPCSPARSTPSSTTPCSRRPGRATASSPSSGRRADGRERVARARCAGRRRPRRGDGAAGHLLRHAAVPRRLDAVPAVASASRVCTRRRAIARSASTSA